MAKKRIHKKRRGRAKLGKASRIIKRPIILADVESRAHAMHRDSGLIIYWLTLLALVVLSMLSALVISVLQFAVSSQKILLVVAGLGFFFGYVSNRFVSLVGNLETRHHVFARLIVPAAAVLNLVIITSAANGFVRFAGIGYAHSPILVGLVYGIAFVLPPLASATSTILRSGRSRRQ